MPTETATVIEFGTDAYTYDRIFVQTYSGAVYARTTAELAEDTEHAHYGFGDEPTGLLYVDADGNLHPAIIKTVSGQYDEDDYLDVSAEVQDVATGAVIARFGYRLDGRS